MATKKYVSLDKLSLYDEKIKAFLAAADTATLDAAKAYSDGLADNYEAAGNVATAQAALQKNIDDAQAAAEAADAKAAGAQGEVDALETYVGTFTASEGVDTVVKYIDKKTEGIASEGAMTALAGRVTDAEGAINAIEADYLKAADKTELSDAIAAEVARADAAEKANAASIKAISDDYLKNADKEALQGSINEVAGAVDAIEADYLKAADKTELQGKIDAKVAQADYDAKMEELDDGIDGLQTQINTIMNNPDAAGAINSINEFTQYVTDHGAIAEGFRTDINKNKEDIATMDAAYKAADTAMQGRLDALEGSKDAYVAADTTLKNELNAEIAKKADASTVSDMDAAYKAADEALSGRLDNVEAALGDGEGSVSDMISDAIDAEEARVDGLLANKVDKVNGKDLSTNDLTDELKGQYDAAYAHSQVAHAPADAQANVIESVKVNGVAQPVTGKAVDISVPTDNAELANGAGYLVAADIANKADKATTLAGYGIADAYTSAQTDTAIANAIGQFVECSEAEINALFSA